MKSLAIEHNLTEDELFKAVISLAKSADLQERVHDSLEKAMTVGPVEPSDPEVAYLKKKFRQLFSDAITGIMSDLDAIVPQGKLKKAVAAPVILPLTPEQVRTIQQTIRDRFNYIAAQVDGNYVPDEITLRRWKKMGLIAPDVTADNFSMSIPEEARLIMNAFVFGRFSLAVERGGRSFADILHLALTLPLTKPDKFAIQVAETQAAAYITQFGEGVGAAATAAMTARNRQIVHDMAVKLHSGTLQAKKLNDFAADKIVKTWPEFKSELYHAMDDKARDWDRIAHYELYDSRKHGEALALLERWGPTQLVYKKPLKTACPQCKHLYLDGKGNPKLFRIGKMLSYGSNIGRKPHPTKGGVVTGEDRPDGEETLAPVVGLLHPWCECMGPFLFTGMEDWADDVATPA